MVLVGLVFLLTKGKPKPRPVPRQEQHAVAASSAGVQDAFAYAKDLQSRLSSDAKYSRLYLVPSAASANQKQGKVVVMGELASDEALRALQAEVAKAGIPVTLEWQVTIPGAQAQNP